MSQLQQSAVNNRLLKALSPDDFGLLAPHLKRATKRLHEKLIAPHIPIEQLYFVESGFASVTTHGVSQVEIGLIGREGLVGAALVLLQVDRSPYDHFIQSPGEVLSIGIDEFSVAVDQSKSLRTLLLRFVHSLLVQTAQTAFANATQNVDVRLARWLLMCQDRLESDEIAITHEFLSMMLGVQRTSVTLALQALEGAGLIWGKRARVVIRDRDKLIAMAGDSYGLPEAEYAWLIESVPEAKVAAAGNGAAKLTAATRASAT
jgi:CRP-like cAMP-binding protein